MPGRRNFGSIFRRRRSDGRPVKGNFRGPVIAGHYIRVQIDGREVWRKAGNTREEAEMFLERLRQGLWQEEVLGVRPIEEMKFRDFAAGYILHVERTHSPTTVRQEKVRINSVLVPEFGDTDLSRIAREDVERFLNKLDAKGKAPATLNRYSAMLSAMFRRAVALGHARTNPVHGIRRRKEALRDVPFLTFDEQDRLVDECPEPLRSFVTLALDTGARRGELLGLRWADVDVALGRIHLRHTKNGDQRTIPLPARSRDRLERLDGARAEPKERHVRVFAAIPESWPGDWTKLYEEAWTRAKLPRLRIHDLRHAAAVNLVRAGVPLPDVGRLLGHRTLLMVMRYARHAPADAGDRAIGALEAARKRARTEASETEQAGRTLGVP